MHPAKTDIQNLTKKDLINWLSKQGLRSFRADQIFKWLYLHHADTFDAMTDLGKATRSILSSAFVIHHLHPVSIETSVDGSRKYLFKLVDGNTIESVLIPEKNHYTLCVSTQVGCAQGCRFCMTAKSGFIRNLTAGEIIAQVRDIKKSLDNPEQFKNLVFMGMGEPLANYRNVVAACETITDSDCGLKFSTRRVTISTAGLVPHILRLGFDTSVGLAISLNATDNKTRSWLMPINRTYPIEALLDACKRYPLPPRRKITFEYILIKGVNDSLENARRLAAMLRPIKAKINLIPFNEHPGSDFQRPSESAVSEFLGYLHDSGYTAIIRHSKGADISAACGQLRARAEK